jgi:glycosyltransferase involved in cell wall biosynthesis
MSSEVDGVSVVTPTHGRGHLVAGLLESLRVARAGSSRPTEVIIIDSSPREEAETIRAACEEFEANYVRHQVNNVRQKRNIGVEVARFPVVLVIDSDCHATPDLVSEHAQAYSDGVGGVLGLTHFVGPHSLMWKVIERTSVLDAFSYAERMQVAPWGPTCNISYRKSVLVDVGLFDTGFPFRLGGDDVDLGLRVTDSGHRIRCNPRAVVEHTRETWDSVPLISRRLFRWGRMHYHLMRKHPGRVFYDFPSVPGVFILLAVFAAPLAVAAGRPLWVLAPLLWVALELPLEAFMTCSLTGSGLRGFGYQLAARLLGLLYECGTVFEALRHFSLQPLYKEVSYTPPTLHGRNRRVVQVWATVITLVVMASLAFTF